MFNSVLQVRMLVFITKIMFPILLQKHCWSRENLLWTKKSILLINLILIDKRDKYNVYFMKLNKYFRLSYFTEVGSNGHSFIAIDIQHSAKPTIKTLEISTKIR